MPVRTAKNHFLGKEGCRRMNCAQAVLYAFKEKYHIDEDIVEAFGSCGGGGAPEGFCGAFYAAKYVLEKKAAATTVKALENYFSEQAGSLNCRDIRRARKLSCVECVERSSEFLAESAGCY